MATNCIGRPQSRVVLNAAAKTAEVYLYEPIGAYWDGGVSAADFIEELKPLKDATRIDVRINSPGGEVGDGLAIYNTLARYKGRIHTHVDGMAFSIASVIALAGDTVTMADNALWMVHDPWTLAAGNAADLRRLADDLDKTTGQLVTVYKNRTKLAEDKIREMMSAETYLDATEAKRDGFVQHVTESKRVAACAVDPKLMPYMGSARVREYIRGHGTADQWERTAKARSAMLAMRSRLDNGLRVR